MGRKIKETSTGMPLSIVYSKIQLDHIRMKQMARERRRRLLERPNGPIIPIHDGAR